MFSPLCVRLRLPARAHWLYERVLACALALQALSLSLPWEKIY